MSALTPAERHRLATELMGWTGTVIYRNQLGVACACDDDWLPDQSWDQAGMVAEELVERSGRPLTVVMEHNRAQANIPSRSPSIVIGKRIAPLAICRAALAWCDARKGKP